FRVPIAHSLCLNFSGFSLYLIFQVVQAFTDPKAPSRPVSELFSAIPEDGRRKAYAETIAKVKAEEAAKITAEKAREAANAAKKLDEEVKNLEA
ncbi:hypothetical protein, partial [Salmonella sp. s58078]|uniref:hypothetical protein n=1 Tax=Salmonella sp. s58078 TaxID=3159699 RepID=UPI0039813739